MTIRERIQKLRKRRWRDILRPIVVPLLFLLVSCPLVFGIATLGIQRDSDPWLPFPVAYQSSANYSVDQVIEARPRVREEVIEDVEKDALVATAPPPTIVAAESLTPTPSSTPSATPIPADLIVNAGGPYEGEEGRRVPVRAEVEEFIGIIPGSITYRWDMDNDKQYDDQQGASATALFFDEGEYTIGVEATDFLGRVATDTATVSVINVPPIVRIGEDQIADEAEEVVFEAFADDPGNDILTYEWDFGDGVVTVLDTLSPRHTYADNGDYIVRLRVTDNDNGVNEDTLFVQILNLPPFVDAGPDQTVSEGSSLTLSGTATDPAGDFDPLAYAWDLDYDGNDFEADVFGPVVSSLYPDGPKTQVAALRVEDDDGGQTIDTLSVRVENETPSITRITNNGPAAENSSLTIEVTATDIGSDTLAYAYDWENDGAFDLVNQPATASHIWEDDGNYIVGVRVDDGDGGQVFATAAISIYNVAPTAIANRPDPSFEGSTVAFNATGSTDPSPVDVLSYEWDFGDGNPPATGLNATHIYEDNGSYNATLTARDDDGGVGMAIVPVTILNANPVANPGSYPSIKENELLTLTGSATDPGSLDTAFTYAWDLDNNGTFETPGQIVSKTPLDGPDTFNVALRVQDKDYPYPTDNGGEIGEDIKSIQITVNNVDPTNVNAQGPYNGLEGQPVPLAAADATDVASDTLTYDWDINNNGVFTVTGQTVTYTWSARGVYPITLRVKDEDGGEAFDPTTVEIGNSPPVAVAGVYTGTENSPITLDGGGSYDPSVPPDPLTYAWDLDNDGVFETPGQMVNYTWPNEGVYTVDLQVDDGNGGVSTDTATITVNNLPPIAVALASPTNIPEGDSVTFNGNGSTDPGPLDILTYQWDFGDGSPPANGGIVNYTYRDEGVYNPILTVTDDAGAFSIDDTIAITVTNVAPTAVITTGPLPALEGEPLLFGSGLSSDPGPDDTLTYEWDFGDDSPITTTTGVTITHAFPDGDQVYTVTLTVDDGDGRSDTITTTLPISNANPIVNAGGPYTTTVGQTIPLMASGTDVLSDTLTYNWDLDNDGAFDDAAGQTVTFTNVAATGLFTISVQATDEDGGVDTNTTTVTVNSILPIALLGGIPYLIRRRKRGRLNQR